MARATITTTTAMSTSSPRDESERAAAAMDASPRAAKKLRPNSSAPSRSSSRRALTHPFGVKPVGNFYEDAARGVRDCRAPGLGAIARLPDAQLLELLGFLSATDLSVFGACSRASYVFSAHDELWRTLVLEEMEGAFSVRATWRDSYVATKSATAPARVPIAVQGFYSDLLFQSFYCAAAPIEESWLAVETIDRRSAADLSLEEFKREYEAGNRPVILTEAIRKWPAMEKWTDEYLVKACEGQTFYAGGYQLSMDKYLHYSRTLVDDQPLFIFDRHFAGTVPALAADYDVPEYFREDFFSLLGDERPDYRWLIIGPKKSGSSFHIDPNATNAWNGVVRGAKKWIMFPPEVVPPGVHPSEEGDVVSTPVSLMEWMVTFYPQIKKLPPHLKPLEGVCREGELMFVPHGWWHLVLNLDESIAVTQNFVCSGNVRSVLRFLRDKPEQVSGTTHEKRPLLGSKLRAALETHQPALLAAIDEEWAEELARKSRKSKWELLLEGSAQAPASDLPSSAAPAPASASASAPASSFGFGFTFDE